MSNASTIWAFDLGKGPIGEAVRQGPEFPHKASLLISADFAETKSAAMRPQIVGAALQKISQDREIADAMFQTLETQNIITGEADITLVPKNSALVADLLAAQETRSASKPTAPTGARASDV